MIAVAALKKLLSSPITRAGGKDLRQPREAFDVGEDDARLALLRRKLPRLDELLGDLRRDITAEDPMDAGSLGLGGGMRSDHVACAVDGQRRDARHQRNHHALVHAEADAEEVGIEHDREIVFARRRAAAGPRGRRRAPSAP